MGFLALDVLSSRFDIPIKRLKYNALIGEGYIGTEKVVLVKPQTFMNCSGEALRPIVEFYKVPHDHLILIYDDIDIPLGTLRVRKSGSAGTHNGMRSVIYQLQFDDFPRIRVGIGGKGDIPLMSYVIGKITDGEKDVLVDILEKAATAAETIVRSGIDVAMNKCNIKPPKPPKPPKKQAPEPGENGETAAQETAEAAAVPAENTAQPENAAEALNTETAAAIIPATEKTEEQ